MPRARLALAAGTAALLTACASAPPYIPPQVTAPAAYKEAGAWTAAAPADAAPRGDWWTIYSDPVLNGLEIKAAAANPTLAAAVAAHDQAQAYLTQARASLLPTITGSAQPTRQRRSEDAPLRAGGPDDYSTNTLGGALSYEIDLWGRVRSQVAAAGAQSQASAADLASVRLSLQAQVADTYLALRGLDAQQALLADAVQSYARALNLTQIRHDGGNANGMDVGRAQTQLYAAQAQVSEVIAQRALYEHALAALVGEPASGFSLSASAFDFTPPHLPAQAPSLLLQRRPDVAAAERRAAAANAQIGVAHAARFPTLTIGASAGWQNAGGSSLIGAPNAFWMIAPQLAATLFDSGRLKAGERAARAGFDQQAQVYRGVVLGAFREVEDQLVLTERLAEEARQQDDAVTAAKRTESLANIRYRQGASTYLEVVTAQTASLQAQRASVMVATRRMQASVDLVRALGGGWDGAAAAL